VTPRQLTYLCLPRLAYLNAVIDETMRLFPVAATGSVRCAAPNLRLCVCVLCVLCVYVLRCVPRRVLLCCFVAMCARAGRGGHVSTTPAAPACHAMTAPRHHTTTRPPHHAPPQGDH
jgi:hypothetical protein